MMESSDNLLTLAEPSPWGDCPRCGRNDGYLNDGRDHWFVCRRHRLKWYVGSGLFASWRHESPAQPWRQQAELATYQQVEPLMRMPPAAYAPTRRRVRRGEPSDWV